MNIDSYVNIKIQQYKYFFNIGSDFSALGISTGLQCLRFLDRADASRFNDVLTIIDTPALRRPKPSIDQSLIRQVVSVHSRMLLLGETDVGKGILANAIYYLFPRNEGPFVKVTCGATPETLLGSVVFGYEKGAFTGAITQKRGRFERALIQNRDIPLRFDNLVASYARC